MAVKQISENVFQVALGIVNAFVIRDEHGLTLVDTGTQGSGMKIMDQMTKAGLNPGTIRRIILTHCHPDHSGSAAELKDLLKIPVLAHQLDAEIMAQGIGSRGNGVISPGILNWILGHLFINRIPKTIKPVAADGFLNDGDVLPIAGGVQVIHTPGHTAGHLAFFVKKDRLLIAADICSNAAGLDLSVMYEDRALGIKSILKAAEFDFDIAVFGHGNAVMADASGKMKEKFGGL